MTLFLYLMTLEKQLLKASKEGCDEKVAQLISNGADVNVQDVNGRAPIHWALYNEHEDIVKLLISNGADVNIKDKENWTPLHVISSGCIEFLDMFELHLPLNSTSKDWRLKMMKLLLEHGADVNVSDECGWTPLHCSAFDEDIELVKMLISHGANVNVKNERGWTPLFFAFKKDNIELAKLLISYGADISVKDKDGDNLLHNVSHGGHFNIIKLLL